MLANDYWRHRLCWECWAEREPGRIPVTVLSLRGEPFLAPCCVCHRLVAEPIYQLGPASDFTCGGNHLTHTAAWLTSHGMIGTWIEHLMIDVEAAMAEGIDES